ncbi:phosphoglucosamine mutase [Streptococcus dysgalactiae]|uniref:phosphoglucosamine mutase n=1 Tax=Streptococcus dysgalactiae TaxID=1334 RepID=UPI000E05A2D7|nr:phosphoglucosamine mutase [Streptococcus dysgalactiae]MCB2829382.1 phosphoglucosamine mutase [Streptococcus dysgalactiae subsp. dysgalactiae]MCB2831645.1 phosphoglucosamine mutase [Streptococcus dysgalactiae subsp. dysgalactiae]MCB2835352.1 phosphoglucosamine mutase [Streptococcus dysgalactiae subsp. dysgalactiae]MCB2839424.1 phosphoglucosamine mutase [Streptococcus dysgalactiae subsp. dysgalactiae]MCB2842852.1 phosphoglucosamine mutase [Streptococcus dysgalactiae subsp. dysgalactiae]
MGKYFGTDGVRGEANVELTPELAFKLGRFGGYVLSQHETERPKVFVARDTRISGEMLESALIAGLLSVGIEVYKLGVLATPGVSYLVRTEKASAGVMISASHNPALDNGIKFFGNDGFKLADDQELEIEALLDAPEDTLPRPSAEGLGTLVDYPEGLRKYEKFLVTTGTDLSGMTVALDTANGAASVSARDVFLDLNAEIAVIGEKPNGLNINDGVGSTHPEQLQELVKETGADLGLAFDGDSDRLIAVDETGEIVDGDRIMFIIGKYLSEKRLLAHNTIVTTVMSNLGFHKALDKQGINKAITAVGDRYVVEEMRRSGYNLGGEQSGHVIIMDYNTTGDGQLTAIQLTKVMKETGKSLSELAAEVTIYPQKLVNIRVKNSMKERAMEVPAIANIIAKMEDEMAGNGRILVRPSGTEPLLRVMAEAPTDAEVDYYVDTIADVVRTEIGCDN